MVELITESSKMKHIRWILEERGIDVGYVPTMGNLHAGHLSLVEESLRNHLTTIVSIFVNPKQFGPSEDFEKYPRTLEHDLNLLKQAAAAHSKKIYVFHPKSATEIFPPDFDTSIHVPQLSNRLCGLIRPGHFEGVATVVHRLFSLLKPHTAYFGQKDYQQYLVIKRMVSDLGLDVEICGMPIIRGENGIALSSRNQYLSPSDFDLALTLRKTLLNISQDTQNNFTKHKAEAFSKAEVHWDYLEILDAQNLAPINAETKQQIVLGAIKVGSTRLIDNILMEPTHA